MTIPLTRESFPRLRPAILIGLLGEGVGPSLTPLMHELEGSRQGMHYVYRSIDLDPSESSPEGAASLLAAARRLGFTGVNVTHPLKQIVVPLIDELDASAEAVGAVNTIVFTTHGNVGYNTDVTGFSAAFDEAFEEPIGRVILLGAGGAGSALATALRARGCDLVIVDADQERARSLATQVGGARTASTSEIPALLPSADVIINATPQGMAAHPGAPFDTDLLTADHRVADIVYRPTETTLLRAARARGCRVMDGLGMAMHQAADAFEIFTGVRADRSHMLADLHELVAAEARSSLPPPPQHTGEPS